MSEERNRVNLSLDSGTLDILKEAANHSGVKVAGIVSRLLGAHMSELAEYLEWMDAQAKGSRKHEYGKNLLVSYGPESLVEAIRQIDPTWKFKCEEFEEGIRSSKTVGLDNLERKEEGAV